ncbi:SLOG family protein [Bacillaceae bacterium C204]|uniref:SLOG family protein n=1 Tax=Neobacillus sp. 204 TaxID=3383351 RepID=UPI00397A5F63
MNMAKYYYCARCLSISLDKEIVKIAVTKKQRIFTYYISQEKSMNRVIVTGSKDFDDYDFLKRKLDLLLKDKSDIVIVSDEEKIGTMGEKWAVSNDADIVSFPIHWDEYGRDAAKIRNDLMYNFANYSLIFWNGMKNDQAGFAVGAAKKYGIDYKIIRY